MSRRFLLFLFVSGLLVVSLAAVLEQSPGYMDADYYYAGALRLAAGQGGQEPYLWNYLNGPAGLPGPSFAYWMPLAALVGAGGLLAAPGLGFWGARLGFFLFAGLIPPLTALLAERLTGQPRQARMAGLLALVPGFYLAYLPTTDTFAINMVLGALFFLAAFPAAPHSAGKWPVAWRMGGLGFLAGLYHLGRADGLLWLAGALFAALAWFRSWRSPQGWRGWTRLVGMCSAVLAGYALVMAPWFAHNLQSWGTLFPPGGARALWVTAYEQTFLFPADQISFSGWWAAGLAAHLRTLGTALGTNLQSTLAVQGEIILLPFMILGLWRLRRCPEVRLWVVLWLLMAGAMTIVFPFAGSNGGFFHSSASFQPLLWAVTPLGIDAVVAAYARLRHFERPQTFSRFVYALLLAVCLLFGLGTYYQRVVGSQAGALTWNASSRHYQAVEKTLLDLGAEPDVPVLVNNPPGYWLASGRPAIVIPNGDTSMLLSAAKRYQAGYLVLEVNNPFQLAPLYQEPGSMEEFEYLTTVGDTRLYRIAGTEIAQGRSRAQ